MARRNTLLLPNLIEWRAHIPTASPLLEGKFIAGSSSYNLTSLTGAYGSDWAYWGLSTAGSFDHKSGVGKISNATLITTTGDVFHRYSGAPISATWTDGTPDASATNTTAGIYIQNPGSGFSFTVPAELFPQTITMYVGCGGSCQGQLTATLSDNSVSPYVDSSIGIGAVGIYIINFSAKLSGQTLTITWVEIGGPYTPGTTNVALNFAILVGLLNKTADTTSIAADSTSITADS